MKSITRRRALKTLGAAAAAGGLPMGAGAAVSDQTTGGITVEVLLPIADVVLPAELGDSGRRTAVAAFVRWVRNYREGAETDHGYGNTRIRSTGPSPARDYPKQLASLDDAARAQGAGSFASAPAAARRGIVESALAAANVARLPRRPTGAHIASDLMGHYFNSPAAQDLCYRAAIGRDSCRGLPGSEERPKPLVQRA